MLLASLLLLAAGLLARGALPGLLLFPGTVLASAGIALMNVLLPSLVKRRRPDQAGLLIGVYLLSLAAGAILGSLIAVPVFQSSGGSARVTLGLWALPALAAVLAWLPQWRFRTTPAGLGGGPLGRPAAGEGPQAHTRLASHGLHGAAEPDLLLCALVAADPAEGPGRGSGTRGRPARLDEPW